MCTTTHTRTLKKAVRTLLLRLIICPLVDALLCGVAAEILPSFVVEDGLAFAGRAMRFAMLCYSLRFDAIASSSLCSCTLAALLLKATPHCWPLGTLLCKPHVALQIDSRCDCSSCH
eukprot:2798837-Amphidinium_carterae.1